MSCTTVWLRISPVLRSKVALQPGARRSVRQLGNGVRCLLLELLSANLDRLPAAISLSTLRVVAFFNGCKDEQHKKQACDKRCESEEHF